MNEIKTFFPETLKPLPIWGLWKLEQRDGRQTKVPYNALSLRRASSTNPDDWTTYDKASSVLAAHVEEFSGLGLVIMEKYHLLFLDVDHCIDDSGELDCRAQDLLETFSDPDQYIELSQSRTGLHAIALGMIPRSFKNSKNGCEMYSSGRFCALTGWAISPHEPAEAESAISYWFEKYKTQRWNNDVKPKPKPEILRDDRWIIDHAKAREGKFTDLFAGEWSKAGYNSQSEADLALCLILSFWTDRDAVAIDRLFRQSGLYRYKWERPSYRETTLNKAINELKESLSEFQKRRMLEEGRQCLEWFDHIRRDH